MRWSFNCLFILALTTGMVWDVRASSQTQYAVEEQVILQQTSSSSIVAGYSPLGYPQIGFNAKVNTVGGISLSAAPILTFPNPTTAYPSGFVTFPTGTNFSPSRPSGSGYNGYWVDP